MVPLLDTTRYRRGYRNYLALPKLVILWGRNFRILLRRSVSTACSDEMESTNHHVVKHPNIPGETRNVLRLHCCHYPHVARVVVPNQPEVIGSQLR